MLIPLSCDAPLYHRPYGTVGVMVLCVLLHLLVGRTDAVDAWILVYGEWAPWQWVSSALVHQGWLHLIGNLVFFWVFGQIIEGKIGPARFVAVVLAIMVLSGAVEQTVMLGADGGSLGLSGVVFGLLAMAWVWAPDNEMDVLLLLFPVIKRWDASVSTMGLIYIGLEVLYAALDGFAMGTAMLHLLGAAAGLPIAIVMLRRGWVDCEGWDWFTRRGKAWTRPSALLERAPSRTRPAVTAAPAPPPAPDLQACLAAGNLDGAVAAWRREGLAADTAAIARLATRLADAGRWDDAIAAADAVLYRDESQVRMRLVRAWALVRSGRPRAAQDALREAAPATAADHALAVQVRAAVEAALAQGGLELA